eukprot:9599696-Prorocentrum_lima.AAC.1
MTSSLVGSEMCIRDRQYGFRGTRVGEASHLGPGTPPPVATTAPTTLAPVSYTHLTLPTICSV